MIHRYWTGPKNLPVVSNAAYVMASQFGIVTDWTDNMLPDYTRSIIDKYETYVPENVRTKQRANIARLGLLYEFGGLWIDHDVLLMDVPDAGPLWAAHDGRGLCSCVIYAEPESDRIWEAINSIRHSGTARYSSGEEMLADIWTDVPTVSLPYAMDGSTIEGAEPWAIHLWATGMTRI